MSIAEATDTAAVYANEAETYLDLNEYNTLHWYPERGTSREFPDVPEHIGAAATEATLCLSLGAYRAVGALARAVIEATAKHEGIATGRLVDKIDKMFDQGLIRQHVKDAAHEVRHFGNDMAHGDFIEPTSEEEAAEAISLMEEVLSEIFVGPAKVQRAQAARLAKQASKA